MEGLNFTYRESAHAGEAPDGQCSPGCQLAVCPSGPAQQGCLSVGLSTPADSAPDCSWLPAWNLSCKSVNKLVRPFLST